MGRTVIKILGTLPIVFLMCILGASYCLAASAGELYDKGLAHYRSGDFGTAVKALRQAIAQDPANNRYWRAYNDAYQADASTRYMMTLTAKYNAITYDEYMERREANPDLVTVDLRLPKDFEKEHIPGAVNIPLEDVRKRLAELPDLKIAEIVVYCVAGPRSATGQMYLSMLGYTNVKYLQGGFNRWKEYREMEKSEKTFEGVQH